MGPEEMAHCLKPQAALSEDPVQFSKPTWQAHEHLVTPILGDITPSLASMGTACVWCTIQAIHTDKTSIQYNTIKINKISKIRKKHHQYFVYF